MRTSVLLPCLLLLFANSAFAAADREAAVASVLLPIAGEVSGAFGTHFQTDVTIANRTFAPVRIAAYWLPQNRSGSLTEPLVVLNLASNATRLFPRFVTDTLHESGLGAIVLRAINDDGSFNTNAHIDAYARVWTPSVVGAGTYSQGIYGSTLTGPGTDDLQPISGWIYGLRHDSAFRTNYGIVNLNDIARTFTITATGENGATFRRTVTLPAASMIHDALPVANYGAVTLHVEVDYIPGAYTVTWTAFGSSVDNATGDAWYSKAQATYRTGPF